MNITIDVNDFEHLLSLAHYAIIDLEERAEEGESKEIQEEYKEALELLDRLNKQV